MTIWKCGCWTNRAHAKDNCIACPKEGCSCCGGRGFHIDPSTERNARKNVNTGLVQPERAA